MTRRNAGKISAPLSLRYPPCLCGKNISLKFAAKNKNRRNKAFQPNTSGFHYQRLAPPPKVNIPLFANL